MGFDICNALPTSEKTMLNDRKTIYLNRFTMLSNPIFRPALKAYLLVGKGVSQTSRKDNGGRANDIL
jgi:hypothetical protein